MKLSWRRPRLLLSVVLAAGALSGLTVAAAPAYAAGPHITVIGGPGEILVQGGGWNADATIRKQRPLFGNAGRLRGFKSGRRRLIQVAGALKAART